MGSIAHHWEQERLKQGIEQGKQQEKIILVKEMIKEQFSIDSITKVTKLSKEEIQKLKI